MTRWLHSRRGVIEGEDLGRDDTWMHVRLTVDSPRASAIARGLGPTDPAGSIITVRRTHIRDVL